MQMKWVIDYANEVDPEKIEITKITKESEIAKWLHSVSLYRKLDE